MPSGRLREQTAPYDDDFGANNSNFALENSYLWNFFGILKGYLGPTPIKSTPFEYLSTSDPLQASLWPVF
jgi:hypothetical protein